jgi:hypothetical protein
MRKVALRLGLSLAAVAMALPMMAKTDKPAKSDVKAKNTSIMIGAPVKFGDTMVKPGTYKLVIDSDKATIENGNKLVASAAGRWEDRKQKAEATGFDSTNGQVDDIFLHGDTNVFVLNGSQASKN